MKPLSIYDYTDFFKAELARKTQRVGDTVTKAATITDGNKRFRMDSLDDQTVSYLVSTGRFDKYFTRKVNVTPAKPATSKDKK